MRLVCLDFSGTLSLGSVMFGQEVRLQRALRRSGLWKEGIRRSDVFWDELVNPAWETGSTTGVGYASLLAQQADKVLRARGKHVPVSLLRQSAARFVCSYLRASSIHPAWRPVLHYLHNQTDVFLLIATDHYAEATPHIVEQLGQWDIWVGVDQRVLVANSADIGAHKNSAPYWTHVQSLLPFSPQQVILVDDFGANEQPLDAYADPAKVAHRQKAISMLLESVFRAPVLIWPFVPTMRRHHLSYKQLLRLYRQKVLETYYVLRQAVEKSL